MFKHPYLVDDVVRNHDEYLEWVENFIADVFPVEEANGDPEQSAHCALQQPGVVGREHYYVVQVLAHHVPQREYAVSV